MNKKAIQKYPSEPPYPGVLSDGSFAPFNTDTARLDYISHFPGVLKNLKSGVRVSNVDNMWQANVRAAIDAAMETERRLLRSKNANPIW